MINNNCLEKGDRIMEINLWNNTDKCNYHLIETKDGTLFELEVRNERDKSTNRKKRT